MPTPGFALITLLSVVAGAALGLSSSQRERNPREWIVAGRLSELPDDGEPHRRIVSAARIDAWSRLPDQPVGQVFLRRVPDTDRVFVLEAFHGLGILVNYDPAAQQFRSCCWNVSFDLEGKALGTRGLYRNHMRPIEHRIIDDDILVRSADFHDSE